MKGEKERAAREGLLFLNACAGLSVCNFHMDQCEAGVSHPELVCLFFLFFDLLNCAQ